MMLLSDLSLSLSGTIAGSPGSVVLGPVEVVLLSVEAAGVVGVGVGLPVLKYTAVPPIPAKTAAMTPATIPTLAPLASPAGGGLGG